MRCDAMRWRETERPNDRWYCTKNTKAPHVFLWYVIALISKYGKKAENGGTFFKLCESFDDPNAKIAYYLLFGAVLRQMTVQLAFDVFECGFHWIYDMGKKRPANSHVMCPRGANTNRLKWIMKRLFCMRFSFQFDFVCFFRVFSNRKSNSSNNKINNINTTTQRNYLCLLNKR